MTVPCASAGTDAVHPFALLTLFLIAFAGVLWPMGCTDGRGGLGAEKEVISETKAAPGDAFAGVTSYSYPVLASEPLALGDYVKPAADGSGRAAKGTAANHCARALHNVIAGKLVECELVQRVNGA